VFRLTLELSSYKIVFSLFGKRECRIQINKHIWAETCNFVKIGSKSHLEVPNGRYDLCLLSSVVAVFSGGVAIVFNFCNLEF